MDKPEKKMRIELPFKEPEIDPMAPPDNIQDLHHEALDAIWLTDQRSAEFYYNGFKGAIRNGSREDAFQCFRETLIYASAVSN